MIPVDGLAHGLKCSVACRGYLTAVVGWCVCYLYLSVTAPLPETIEEIELSFHNLLITVSQRGTGNCGVEHDHHGFYCE